MVFFVWKEECSKIIQDCCFNSSYHIPYTAMKYTVWCWFMVHSVVSYIKVSSCQYINFFWIILKLVELVLLIVQRIGHLLYALGKWHLFVVINWVWRYFLWCTWDFSHLYLYYLKALRGQVFVVGEKQQDDFTVLCAVPLHF